MCRRSNLPKLVAILAAVPAASSPAHLSSSNPWNRQDRPGLRQPLEEAVRHYLLANESQPHLLERALELARGRHELLAEIIVTKSYLPRTGIVARRGTIDERYRFVEVPGAESRAHPGAPPGKSPGVSNPAFFHGPATSKDLSPFTVFVPDATNSTSFERVVAKEGTDRGWYVFLVPDEQQDNLWNPSQHEHHRHVGPLRDFLLRYPIDPDRVFMIGTGRGGHATWDVGLLYADRWAGIFPCNGGLIHEGGYKASGGVFLENAKCLSVFTVYNTTSDHGIHSCRYAARKFEEWGYRFEAAEEPRMRNMGIVEATEKLASLSRDAHPREIVKRFNHLDAGDHYWLRALDRTPRVWDPNAKITVRGSWPKDPERQLEVVWDQVKNECGFLKGSVANNRIEVTARGVGHLRVYFDPKLVDYAAKVTVVINGKAQSPVALEKKPEVMLQHVRETGDTSRLYWAFREYAVK